MAGYSVLRAFAALAVLASQHVEAINYPTRFDGVTWDDSNWRITTTDLIQGQYQSRMSLANGYLGINLAALGPFFEVDDEADGAINGWPLFDRRQTFATISGFWNRQDRTNGTNFEWLYQYETGESVISGVPHWSGLHIKIGDEVLSASTPADQISGYSSTMDFAVGVLTWQYTWSPADTPAIDVTYTAFVHKLYVNQAVIQVKITPSRDVNASVIDVLNGDNALRTDPVETIYEPVLPAIVSAVSPVGVSNVTAYIASALVVDKNTVHGNRTQFTDASIIGGNTSSIAQAMDVTLKAEQTTVVTKFVGGASTDAFSNPAYTASCAVWDAVNAGFYGSFESHIDEWNSILTNTSVDSYRLSNGSLPEDMNVQELQITAITNPYHLLQQTVGANAIAAAGNNTQLNVNSIAVGGLGSESYAGWIFWDAEVWMAPGLVVAFPQAAEQIANYRVKIFPQAQENINVASPESGTVNQTGRFSANGAAFPWVSGRYGNCTGAGPCFDYEYHLNGDIGLELYNLYTVTGDTDYFRSELFPIYDAVAQFYADVVTYNETIDQYELLNATDPDEYANFERNVGFTMVLMKTHLETANTLRERFGQEANATWADIASKILIPVYDPANIILEYADMNNSVQVKQADVVLVDDLLDFPNNQSLSDLDYYAGKQSLNGPGMTYGVFSIVANTLSPSGCSSFTYDLYGSQPYTRAPWFQFSEQLLDDYTANGGTHPAYPFLTGIGGANRVAVFGYLGLKLTLDSLSVNPSLPPQISDLRYRTIYWQGWPVSAVSNQSHTTLTRLSTPLANANSTFATSAIPVTIGIPGESQFGNTTIYHLQPNSSITLTNRRIGDIKTVEGNIAQCRPANSPQATQPGQFPLSAVDGAVSTKWQPEWANISSSLIVELAEPFVPISAIQFDWAQAPPTSYNVTFSNSTTDDADAVEVTSSSSVEISNAYNAAEADLIVPYASNTTNVSLKAAVYSGRYATLTILGNHANDGTANEKNGTGATVAEFVLVAAGGDEVTRRHVGAWEA